MRWWCCRSNPRILKSFRDDFIIVVVNIILLLLSLPFRCCGRKFWIYSFYWCALIVLFHHQTLRGCFEIYSRIHSLYAVLISIQILKYKWEIPVRIADTMCLRQTCDKQLINCRNDDHCSTHLLSQPTPSTDRCLKDDWSMWGRMSQSFWTVLPHVTAVEVSIGKTSITAIYSHAQSFCLHSTHFLILSNFRPWFDLTARRSASCNRQSYISLFLHLRFHLPNFEIIFTSVYDASPETIDVDCGRNVLKSL